MLRSEFLVEAARLCRVADRNVASVLTVTDDPPRVILEYGDASTDLKTFLRHRSSTQTSSFTDTATCTAAAGASTSLRLSIQLIYHECYIAE